MVISNPPSHRTADVTEERADEFDTNIGLTRRFVSALLDDDALAESLPIGATVFVLPDEDPELAAKNLARAHEASLVGRDVVIWKTSGQMTHIQSLRPKWPAQAEYVPVSVDYYAGEDVLKVRFDGLFDEQHPSDYLEHNQFATITVDRETGSVVGYELPRFLAETANIASGLASWLGVATLHGTTAADIAQMPDADHLQGLRLSSFEDFQRYLEHAAASN